MISNPNIHLRSAKSLKVQIKKRNKWEISKIWLVSQNESRLIASRKIHKDRVVTINLTSNLRQKYLVASDWVIET